MDNTKNLIPSCEQESFNGMILEAYERADESTRMDMYMAYRDLRECFDETNVCSARQGETVASRAKVEPAKMKWCLCGRFRKAFSG